MFRYVMPTIFCLCFIPNAFGQATPLDGVYERISLTNLTSGQQLDPTQKGLMIVGHGYYAMMTINPDRPKLERGQRLDDLPPDKQIAHMKSWLQMNGHTGPIEVKADTLIWYRNLSENPQEVGTVSRLPYELKDGNLVIHFDLGNSSRWEWIWRKVK